MKRTSAFAKMTFGEMNERIGWYLTDVEYVFIYNGICYEYVDGYIYSAYAETWHDKDIFDEKKIADVYKVNEMYYIEFIDGKNLPEAEFIDDREELGRWEGL